MAGRVTVLVITEDWGSDALEEGGREGGGRKEEGGGRDWEGKGRWEEGGREGLHGGGGGGGERKKKE